MGACACIGNVVLLVPLVPAEKYERKNDRTQVDNRGKKHGRHRAKVRKSGF